MVQSLERTRFVKPIFHCDAKLLQKFALAIPTCWYLKTLKFALPPTQIPNESQWNIGCIGSPTQNFGGRFHSRWVPFFSGIWALDLFWSEMKVLVVLCICVGVISWSVVNV